VVVAPRVVAVRRMTLQHHRPGQLPVPHLLLHQVLHAAHLHVVHEAGPVCAAAPTVSPSLRGAGGIRVRGGARVVADGAGAAVAADAESLQALGDVLAVERSPAALAHQRHVVAVALCKGREGGRKEGREEGRKEGGKAA